MGDGQAGVLRCTVIAHDSVLLGGGIVVSPSEKPTAGNADIPALPPGLAMYHLAVGHYISRALFVAAKLEIADLLKDGPRNYGDLAEATKTHAPSLNRMLRLLASVGVFEEREGGIFALKPLGETLCTSVSASMRDVVLLFAGSFYESWRELEYCVQTGEPGFRRVAPDADFFMLLAQDPEAAATFDKAMAAFAPQTAAAVVAAYDFSAFQTVVDVGGGNGTLLIDILKANPRLGGIIFDLPHVTERAREQLQIAATADRCTVASGSFFAEVPKGADAYLLKHVIHDWNDERATVILKNCRTAMPARGKLLIVEGVYPPRIEESLPCRSAAANDVNMLVNTGGRQRSEAEFRELLTVSGFRLSRVIPTKASVCVIEGECA